MFQWVKMREGDDYYLGLFFDFYIDIVVIIYRFELIQVYMKVLKSSMFF